MGEGFVAMVTAKGPHLILDSLIGGSIVHQKEIGYQQIEGVSINTDRRRFHLTDNSNRLKKEIHGWALSMSSMKTDL